MSQDDDAATAAAVALKRHFMSPRNPWLFLCDEAHNLVDRGRDAYSATLEKAPLPALKRHFKGHPHIASAIDGLNRALLDLGKELKRDGERYRADESVPEMLERAIAELAETLDASLLEGLSGDERQALQPLHRALYEWTAVHRIMGEGHRFTIEQRRAPVE